MENELLITDAIELEILESLRLEGLNLSQMIYELEMLPKYSKIRFTDYKIIHHLNKLEVNGLVRSFPVGGLVHWQITLKGAECVNKGSYISDNLEEEMDRDFDNAWREFLERKEVGLYSFEKGE